MQIEVFELERSPEELYRERISRFEDAIQLKVPDRVPIFWSDGGGSFFPARYVGMTVQEAIYDAKKWFWANKKVILDHEPDIYASPNFTSGRVLEILDHKTVKLPGREVSPDQTLEFTDEEFMKTDEYDALLDKPSDYTIRTFLPRVYRALEPLKELFPLWRFSIGDEVTILTSAFAKPEIATAFNSLVKAGREAEKWMAERAAFDKEMHKLGFPSFAWNIVMTPFDTIASPLRGTRGVMLDMYRKPEKLLEATERITPWLIENIVAEAKRLENKYALIGLYWGVDGYMSLQQFETFYWPGLKKLVSGLMDAGLTVMIPFHGSYISKLDYIAELPKGKIICLFDYTDIFKAKEILGDNLCLIGKIPVSMFQIGTPKKIKEYGKKLIDIVGEGGGFIMSGETLSNDTNPRLLKMYIDFIKEYGVYNR